MLGLTPESRPVGSPDRSCQETSWPGEQLRAGLGAQGLRIFTDKRNLQQLGTQDLKPGPDDLAFSCSDRGQLLFCSEPLWRGAWFQEKKYKGGGGG
jgi:hypothetical protein